MTNYEQLLIDAECEHIITKEKTLNCTAKGLIKGNKILISKNLSSTEKKVILSEELGHYHTTVGNILNMEDIGNRKQELRARVWSYNKLIGLNGIINAHKQRCLNFSDMADYLDITEDFLHEALEYYKGKYGVCIKVDNYIIYFEPNIGVLELI